MSDTYIYLIDDLTTGEQISAHVDVDRTVESLASYIGFKTQSVDYVSRVFDRGVFSDARTPKQLRALVELALDGGRQPQVLVVDEEGGILRTLEIRVFLD